MSRATGIFSHPNAFCACQGIRRRQEYCQAGSSPNGAPDADVASITSHELTEAMIDPELNAWYSASGSEIGDLCAWNYGTNNWDGGLANESWPVSLNSLFIHGHPAV